MKTLRSPNLAPGDNGLKVMVTLARGYAKGGLVSAANKVRGAGRFGDTLLVHINEHEFEQLKRAWGEPHYNPQTKLPEFFDFGSLVSGGLDAIGMGSWKDAIKTAAPYVMGAISGKTNIDAANRNLAPLPDANMQRPLGNYTNARQYTPPKVDPKSYYTYGQTSGAPTFFKNNSLGAVTGAIPAPLQGPKQYSPSALGAVGMGIAQGALSNLANKYLGGAGGGGGRTAEMTLGQGQWLPDVAGAGSGAAGAGAGAGAAGAAGETYGSLGALGGTSSGIGSGGSLVGGGIGAEGLGAEGAGAASGIGAGTGAGAGAGAGTGASAGTGSLSSGLATAGAGALAAAPFLLAANQIAHPSDTLSTKWYANLMRSVDGGGSGNATYDKYTPASEQQYKAKQALYQLLANSGSGVHHAIPPWVWEKAKSLGMLNAQGTAVNPNWNAGTDPFTARAGTMPGGGGRPMATGGLAMAEGGPVVKKWISKLAEAHFNDRIPPRWALSSAPSPEDGGRFISEYQSDIPGWKGYLASQRHFSRGNLPPTWGRSIEPSLPGGGRILAEIQSDITPSRSEDLLSWLRANRPRALDYGAGLSRPVAPPLTAKPHFNSDRPIAWDRERSGSDMLGPSILNEIQSDVPAKGYAAGGLMSTTGQTPTSPTNNMGGPDYQLPQLPGGGYPKLDPAMAKWASSWGWDDSPPSSYTGGQAGPTGQLGNAAGVMGGLQQAMPGPMTGWNRPAFSVGSVGAPGQRLGNPPPDWTMQGGKMLPPNYAAMKAAQPTMALQGPSSLPGGGNMGTPGNMIQNAGNAGGNMINNGPGAGMTGPPPGMPPGGLPRLGQPGGMFGGMRPPMTGMAPPTQPQLPRTGFGMNPAWSPLGSPQQNAMPRPVGIGPPQMLPSPSMQPATPMRQPFRQPMMGGLGRAGMSGMFERRAEGGAVSGPGTGTSDDIPARLSDGEYVIPAHVVAALGDGSTAAGAKRLDQFQGHVRKLTGRQMAAGRHPKPAKLPIDFLNDMMARDDENRRLRRGDK